MLVFPTPLLSDFFSLIFVSCSWHSSHWFCSHPTAFLCLSQFDCQSLSLWFHFSQVSLWLFSFWIRGHTCRLDNLQQPSFLTTRQKRKENSSKTWFEIPFFIGFFISLLLKYFCLANSNLNSLLCHNCSIIWEIGWIYFHYTVNHWYFVKIIKSIM